MIVTTTMPPRPMAESAWLEQPVRMETGTLDHVDQPRLRSGPRQDMRWAQDVAGSHSRHWDTPGRIMVRKRTHDIEEA